MSQEWKKKTSECHKKKATPTNQPTPQTPLLQPAIIASESENPFFCVTDEQKEWRSLTSEGMLGIARLCVFLVHGQAYKSA